MKPVTDSYLLGIREARAFFKANPDLTNNDIEAIIDDSNTMLREGGFSPTMRDVFRGERDFWKHQLTKERAK